MKTKIKNPARYKAFTLVLGLSIGYLALPFVVTHLYRTDRSPSLVIPRNTPIVKVNAWPVNLP